MGTTDFGTQTITFDYKSPAKAENFNKLNYLLFPRGIYDGGTLSKVDGTHVNISTFGCFIKDTTNSVGVKIETSAVIRKEVAAGNPYLIIRFEWSNVENNYADVLALAYGDIQSDDLIIGRCVYQGGVLQSTFDYTRRTESVIKEQLDKQDYFKVKPSEPPDKKVIVEAGNTIIGDTYVEFTQSTSSSITDTTDGRNDLVCIDNSGSISVVEGTDAVSPVDPNYPSDKLVVGKISRGSSRTDIKGSDITQIDFTREQKTTITDFAKTLLDDSTSTLARKTLQIAALPAHYERDVIWKVKGNGTAAERYTIVSPSYMTININNNGYVLDSQQELDLSNSNDWDTVSPTDYTTASNRAGKDFYIYAVEPSSGTTPDLILSANSSYPDGYTADNSRKVGGFHCLCVDVGTISGHDLSDYVQGDILPASVWDLNHRPVSDPEGMVWDETSNVWWDIYLASWSSGLQSAYGATIADGDSSPAFHWYNFVEEFAKTKKRLPTQQEFMTAALGSPQETNISGSADPGTTGGHSDTASQRIISNIGCEDMTGVMWQWGAEGGATNDVGSSWAVADTDGTAGSLDDNESIGRGQHYEAPNRPLFGAAWSSGAYCGSRGSSWSNSPLRLSADKGARGVAEPKC